MGKRRFNAHIKRSVAARWKWLCAVCGAMLDEYFEIDHIVPLNEGGEDTEENAQPLCMWDHAEKTREEEKKRLARSEALRNATVRRAPLCCVRCGKIVSPYFNHTC